MGLQQVSATVFNDDSNHHFTANEHLQFNTANTPLADYIFFIEDSEIEEEEREDDDKQHDSSPAIDFAYTLPKACFSTPVFAHFCVPIHLCVEPTERVATQKIPLYALQCAWRHHLT